MSTHAANVWCEDVELQPRPQPALIEGSVESRAGIRNLAFGRTGRVLETLVESGETVRRGDVLARLDCPEVRQDVLIAEAQLELYRTNNSLREVPTSLEVDIARERLGLAQADLAAAIVGRDRLQSLFQKNSFVSKQEMEAAERRVKVASLDVAVYRQAHERIHLSVSAREELERNPGEEVRLATLRRARDTLSMCEIRAPLGAVVLEIHARAGEGVAGGAPALSIVAADPATRDVFAWIPLSSGVIVNVGRQLKVRVPAAGVDSFDATIDWVAPTLTKAHGARLMAGEAGFGVAVWLELQQALPNVPLHSLAYLDFDRGR